MDDDINIGRPGHGYPLNPEQLTDDQVADVLEAARRQARDNARYFSIRRIARKWERTIAGWARITVFTVRFND